MKPMTLKADKDKITFGFETNWEKQFDKKYNTDGCGKALVILEDNGEGLTQRPAQDEIKQLISILLKEQEKELLDRFEKANKGICNIGKKL